MPTSVSPRRGAKAPPAPPPRRRSKWLPIALLAGAAVAAVIVAALPASLLMRFLPPMVRADDFSGTLWHGSAGHLAVDGRDAGAVEWHLHPLALLRLHAATDLHWVKGGFVLDGTVDAERGSVAASDIKGGGPIADLASLGLAVGWRGAAQVRIQELDANWSPAGLGLKAATGEVSVSDLSSSLIGNGTLLGGYSLKFANPAIAADADVSATLTDTGGPLGLDATIRLTPKTRSGLLSGTLEERPDAAPALRNQLQSLAQLRPPDAQGRIPVDLEFTF
jgi:hypothetical protein